MKNFYFPLGITLLLVGLGLYLTSPVISENDAIQNAARITQGAGVERMHTITGAEVANALSDRYRENAERASKRQFGGILGLTGLILTALGMLVRGAREG